MLIYSPFKRFKRFYAGSFSIKTCFYGTSNFFTSNTRRIFTKRLAVSESSVKIESRLHLTLRILLSFSSYLQTRLSVETRLCNIFKTAIVTTLAKIILESHCNHCNYCHCKDSWNGKSWNNPYNFQRQLSFTLS